MLVARQVPAHSSELLWVVRVKAGSTMATLSRDSDSTANARVRQRIAERQFECERVS